MNKIHKGLSWAVILSETSHVFCCVLPSIFSVLSLMVSLGLVSAMPSFMTIWHEAMHRWEVPIILFSAVMLGLGWLFYTVSKKLDCHNTGCGHEPCAPKKEKSSKLLMIATVLFLINISIYLALHA